MPSSADSQTGFKSLPQGVGVVNLRDLSAFPDGAVVDVEGMKSSGLVKKVGFGVKILGEGKSPAL
jgi:ribosomal protein L15